MNKQDAWRKIVRTSAVARSNERQRSLETDYGLITVVSCNEGQRSLEADDGVSRVVSDNEGKRGLEKDDWSK